MNKEALDQMWDQMRQKYGVFLRLIQVIPADRLQSHPIPDMRTPAELVAHVCGTVVQGITEGIAKGEITADEAAEEGVAVGLTSTEEAFRYARECWDRAQEAVARVGDAELEAMVLTPWDMTFPGWVGFHIMRDEFVHHRGQLYVYARACGVAPPFVWGFEDNAPEFGPVAEA